MGELRCHDVICVFTTLADFINLAMPEKFNGAYKAFIAMFGTDLADLTASHFSDGELDRLQERMVETVAVFGGLFTAYDHTFLFHELLHLANHIREMGPLNGWSTYSGERSLSKVKSFLNKDGQAYDKTLIRKYDIYESEEMNMAYSAIGDRTRSKVRETQYLSLCPSH
jgi:hypothetical protein